MKTRRVSVSITLVLASLTVVGVAFILGWKPLLERIELGESTRVLGRWEGMYTQHDREVHMSLVLSSRLRGLCNLKLDASLDLALKPSDPVWKNSRHQCCFRVDGSEIQFLNPYGAVEKTTPFRFEGDELVLLDSAGSPRVILNRPRSETR